MSHLVRLLSLVFTENDSGIGATTHSTSQLQMQPLDMWWGSQMESLRMGNNRPQCTTVCIDSKECNSSRVLSCQKITIVPSFFWLACAGSCRLCSSQPALPACRQGQCMRQRRCCCPNQSSNGLQHPKLSARFISYCRRYSSCPSTGRQLLLCFYRCLLALRTRRC